MATKKKSLPKMTVAISYDLEVFSMEKDSGIEKILKKYKAKRGDSGAGFGARDIEFYDIELEHLPDMANDIKKYFHGHLQSISAHCQLF